VPYLFSLCCVRSNIAPPRVVGERPGHELLSLPRPVLAASPLPRRLREDHRTITFVLSRLVLPATRNVAFPAESRHPFFAESVFSSLMGSRSVGLPDLSTQRRPSSSAQFLRSYFLPQDAGFYSLEDRQRCFFARTSSNRLCVSTTFFFLQNPRPSFGRAARTMCNCTCGSFTCAMHIALNHHPTSLFGLSHSRLSTQRFGYVIPLVNTRARSFGKHARTTRPKPLSFPERANV